MIKMSLDKKALDELAQDLEATPREIKRAIHLALNEVGRAMKSVAARELSKDTGIKRSALKSRLLTFKRKVADEESIKFWSGIYRMRGFKAGAKKVKGGVRIGNQFYKGAFVINGVPFVRIHGKKKALKVDFSGAAVAVLEEDVIPLFEERFLPAVERKLRWLKKK